MAHDVKVSLIDGMRFALSTGSGHEVTLDAGPAVGGGDAGPRPMELLLGALAGCGSMDIIAILRKMRQHVTAYDVSAHGETATEHPRRYTRIDLVHRVAGDALVEANVRRAIVLSMARYCPVYSILAPTVPINARYEISAVDGRVIASGAIGTSELLEQAAPG